jgi:hypothetical protein
MNRSLRSRVDRLEADAPVERFEVWRQEPGGADRWTCRDYPDVVLNVSELDVYPLPPRTERVLVHRVGPDEWGRR